MPASAFSAQIRPPALGACIPGVLEDTFERVVGTELARGKLVILLWAYRATEKACRQERAAGAFLAVWMRLEVDVDTDAEASMVVDLDDEGHDDICTVITAFLVAG